MITGHAHGFARPYQPPAKVHARCCKQDGGGARQLHQAKAVSEYRPVDDNRHQGIDERQRAYQGSGDFLDGTVQQGRHQPGVHQTQGRQQQPAVSRRRQLGPAGERCQQYDAQSELNQHDQVRRHPFQTLDDRRRYRIHKGSAQRQQHASEVIGTGIATILFTANDQQHADEGQ
ncbi:hypothetical protein D3C72_1783020 [compost metagenome]